MLESVMSSMNDLFASQESKYFFLIFALFVFPKFFTRLGMPAALISFLLGIVSSQWLGVFTHDPTIKVLASLGIISLFLFAGLEIDFEELKEQRKVLFGHIFFRIVACVFVAIAAAFVFSIDYRPAAILSLALLTPSAGFILDTLDETRGLPEKAKFWVKIKAISGEIAALLAMFVLVNSSSFYDLTIASIFLISLLVFIPKIFTLFSKKIAPYAPSSEFGFLLMMAVVCGMLTKKLGVYYLVGAFAVGIAARTFEGKFIKTKNLLNSLQLFSSFFVPFYFFHAGVSIPREAFTWISLAYGLLLVLTIIPIRMYSIYIHRKIALKETFFESLPVGTALLPNLVFGLVLAELLLNVFDIPQSLYGALIIYTTATIFLPPIIKKYAPIWRKKREQEKEKAKPVVEDESAT